MKIICVGRNYAQHIEELQNDKPDQPVIFLKPESSLALNPRAILLPPTLGTVHFECEWVLKINCHLALGTQIQTIQQCVSECTLGIDFTARQLQTQLKAKGLPWELAKAFDQSAVLGEWMPLPKKNLNQSAFQFYVNDELRQYGQLSQLIFSFEEIVSFCCQYFSLYPGDIIYTGTPSGVGSVQSGDRLLGSIYHADGQKRELLYAHML